MSKKSLVERYPVLSVKKHTADVYSFRFGDDGAAWQTWAIATICDATGELTIQSDFGDWSHRWNTGALGVPTLTEFLSSRSDMGYVVDKLSGGHQNARIPDSDATCRAIREHIIEQRREYGLKRDEARGHWETAKEFADSVERDGVELAIERMDHDLYNFLGEPWEYVERVDPFKVIVLRDVILPALARHLRGELTEVAA